MNFKNVPMVVGSKIVFFDPANKGLLQLLHNSARRTSHRQH